MNVDLAVVNVVLVLGGPPAVIFGVRAFAYWAVHRNTPSPQQLQRARSDVRMAELSRRRQQESAQDRRAERAGAR